MFRKRANARPGTLIFALIASLALHLFFFGASALLPKHKNRHLNSAPIRVSLVNKTPQKNKDELKKPVVTIAAPPKLERPEKADFLAEYDQTVKEQTKRRLTSPFVGPNRPTPELPNAAAEEKVSRPSSKKGIFARSNSKQLPTPKLFPSWKDMAEPQGMAFNDHIDDVEEDAQTRLNTWQWRHATFFVRVKEAVARKWNPNSAIRRHDPVGELIGRQDHMTQLTASIDQEGKLISVSVTHDSGVYYLDDEALRAFKEAAPFPNPPKALFGSGETFEFPFGFVLSYDRGYKFDLDWKPY